MKIKKGVSKSGLAGTPFFFIYYYVFNTVTTQPLAMANLFATC